jgi:prefoldin subunit 5
MRDRTKEAEQKMGAIIQDAWITATQLFDDLQQLQQSAYRHHHRRADHP